jgi:hypothetical protein
MVNLYAFALAGVAGIAVGGFDVATFGKYSLGLPVVSPVSPIALNVMQFAALADVLASLVMIDDRCTFKAKRTALL